MRSSTSTRICICPTSRTVMATAAFPMSHEDMVGKLGCSELFFVTVRGERVAGDILLYEDDRVRAWSTGVKDGDPSYVKAGAMKALDYLTSQYLAERGYKALHMGGSRPFLLDGVLRHKRGRRVRISDHTKRYFSLSLTAGSVGAKAFVANNPFIYENKGTYRGRNLHRAGFAAFARASPGTLRRIPYGWTGRSFVVRCPRRRRETACADFRGFLG